MMHNVTSHWVYLCRLPFIFSVDAYGNIMYDRRVVRGNTYAQHTLPAVSTPISEIVNRVLPL